MNHPQQLTQGLDSSPDPLNAPGGFPKFADGDIIISAGTGMTWKLHSNALRNASRKLKKMIDEIEGRKITARMREDGSLLRWKIAMSQWSDKPEDMRFRDLAVSVRIFFRLLPTRTLPRFDIT